ncbi:MAG: hypothetical protein EOP84_12755 [Verrucomicrobiaceae bacterium]|nr:MAG: hypothetical protein EOP84_12755 [Verrucomicrobiaceae bacterium]
MMPAEKIGRFAWIGFIVFSAPCAIFCAAMIVIALRMLFVEDAGPIESLPPIMMEKIVAWTCVFAHPMLWTASIFFAHYFNGGLRAALPFILNIFPVVGLLGISYVVGSAESQHSGWPVYYLSILALALIVGLTAVILTSFRRPHSSALSHT